MNLDRPDTGDYTLDFPQLSEDKYQMIIFGLMLIKLILMIIIISLRNRNKRLTTMMKWT